MTDEKVLSGTWEEFETWIREQVGSSFVWKIRPLDIKANRQAVIESILRTIKENNGTFPPKGDTFIALTSHRG